MTTAVASFYYEAPDRIRNLPKRSIYLSFASVTATAGIIGELPDFPSLSMTQPRPAFVLLYHPTPEGELESSVETEGDLSSLIYSRQPYELGRPRSSSLSRTAESHRGQRISLREARQIALQTLADTERRLAEERAAEARFLLSSWEDEGSSAQ